MRLEQLCHSIQNGQYVKAENSLFLRGESPQKLLHFCANKKHR